MKKPLVSVYIPSKNYGHFLEAAVESVLRQTFKEWELFIVDEASSDSTQTVIRNYRTHDKIKVLETDGIGLPAVGNLVLERMSGEFIIRLDGDDVFDENILLVLASHLINDSELAIVFPDYYLMDVAGSVFAQEARELSGSEVSVSDVPPHGACTMIRKRNLLESGGYREDVPAQDGFDLWSRPDLRARSRHIGLPLFFYRQHNENRSSDQQRIFAARRQIKSGVVSSTPKPVTAVIPCRTNYDFRPKLWSVPVKGLSLLERRIEICLTSPLVDQVVVSSDSDEIETSISEMYSENSERLKFHRRTHESTMRSAPIADTLRDVLGVYDPELTGILVLSYLQTPFATTALIEEAIATLEIYEADSAWGVEHISGDLLRRTATGLQPLAGDNRIFHDTAAVYRDSQTFTVFRAKNLVGPALRGRRSVAFEVSEEEGFFVDSERNLAIAEFIANNG